MVGTTGFSWAKVYNKSGRAPGHLLLPNEFQKRLIALNIYDTFDKSAVKNPGECLFSCGHVIVCDFLDFVYLLFIYFF